MSIAFVFPGQGAQEIGMGRALAEAYPAARHVFEEVDHALGQHLFRLMTEGEEAELTLTRNTQPALMAVSLAAARALEALTGKPVGALAGYVAGHSLGEYAALAAAGSLGAADTARLLRTRGEAMQAAVAPGIGAMAALLGLDLPAAQDIAAAAAGEDICVAANDNAPGQVVISGHKAAVERALALAAARGARKSVLLAVSAPFHCPLMAPAAAVMEKALAEVTIHPPGATLIANVTAAPVTEPASIRRLLVEQVTGMVRWRESVERLKAEGVTQIVELGHGRVLSGLIRRIDREIAVANAADPAGLEAVAKLLT